jgi:hypothetical protein
MDEGRKRILAIVAAILTARKLAALDPRPSPALNFAIVDAVEAGRADTSGLRPQHCGQFPTFSNHRLAITGS